MHGARCNLRYSSRSNQSLIYRWYRQRVRWYTRTPYNYRRMAEKPEKEPEIKGQEILRNQDSDLESMLNVKLPYLPSIDERIATEQDRELMPPPAIPLPPQPTKSAAERSFHCTAPGCTKSYKHLKGLRAHFKQKHPSLPVPNREQFKHIISNPTNNVRFHCTAPDCTKSYKYLKGLRAHFKQQHPNLPVPNREQFKHILSNPKDKVDGGNAQANANRKSSVVRPVSGVRTTTTKRVSRSPKSDVSMTSPPMPQQVGQRPQLMRQNPIRHPSVIQRPQLSRPQMIQITDPAAMQIGHVAPMVVEQPAAVEEPEPEVAPPEAVSQAPPQPTETQPTPQQTVPPAEPMEVDSPAAASSVHARDSPAVTSSNESTPASSQSTAIPEPATPSQVTTPAAQLPTSSPSSGMQNVIYQPEIMDQQQQNVFGLSQQPPQGTNQDLIVIDLTDDDVTVQQQPAPQQTVSQQQGHHPHVRFVQNAGPRRNVVKINPSMPRPNTVRYASNPLISYTLGGGVTHRPRMRFVQNAGPRRNFNPRMPRPNMVRFVNRPLLINALPGGVTHRPTGYESGISFSGDTDATYSPPPQLVPQQTVSQQQGHRPHVRFVQNAGPQRNLNPSMPRPNMVRFVNRPLLFNARRGGVTYRPTGQTVNLVRVVAVHNQGQGPRQFIPQAVRGGMPVNLRPTPYGSRGVRLTRVARPSMSGGGLKQDQGPRQFIPHTVLGGVPVNQPSPASEVGHGQRSVPPHIVYPDTTFGARGTAGDVFAASSSASSNPTSSTFQVSAVADTDDMVSSSSPNENVVPLD